MKSIVIFLWVCLAESISAQVGIGTSNPNGSSALEINSTEKGFLPPRMTAAQRDMIAGPVEGLCIWCTNCGVYGQLQLFNGVIWTTTAGGIVASAPLIGDNDGGGKVAYIFVAGDPGYVAGETHGLIAAATDLGTGAEWGCYGTAIPGADGVLLGTGNQNTIDIVTTCASAGIAARICSDFVQGGYSDWYLPSKDELNKVYLNRVAIGGFSPTYYWCSTEIDGTLAWRQFFDTGQQSPMTKQGGYRIRPVRSF